MNTIQHDTPIGPLTITVDDLGALVSIHFGPGEPAGDPQHCRDAVRQLDDYFAGTRRDFDLTLAPAGTEFQRAVWDELTRIPYGGTISYAELAQRIGRPKAVRAVGAANGANPIPIVIPCHRVIGANGTLTGYGGGLPIKQHLLALEHPQRVLGG